MRTIFFLALAAFVAFMAGWFTIDRNDNQTTIRINRDEIREDTSAAFARGKEFLQQQNDRNGGQFAPDSSDSVYQQPNVQNGYPAGYAPAYPNQPVQGDYGQQATLPPWDQTQNYQPSSDGRY